MNKITLTWFICVIFAIISLIVGKEPSAWLAASFVILAMNDLIVNKN